MNPPLINDLCLIYAVAFTSLFLIVITLQIIAIRNFTLTIFKSFGKEFLYSVLGVGILYHVFNLAAVANLAFQKDSDLIVLINGTLSGMRAWLTAIFFSLYCSRQYMLTQIFGTMGRLSKYQSLWPPVVIALILWIPILVFFFLSLFQILPLIFYVTCFGAFYLGYITAFGYYAFRNRRITKIFSDYNANLMVFAALISTVGAEIWLTVEYQMLDPDIALYEIAVAYLFAGTYVLVTLITFLPPVWKWAFDPEGVNSWEEFNKKNLYVYDRSDNQKDSSGSYGSNGVTGNHNTITDIVMS